jgi:nucleotide-binding universal stress UspA family protein
MTVALILVIVILLVAMAALVVQRLRDRARRPAPLAVTSSRRILFPFVAHALSQQALDAALRLAVAENATLVPVFLARVSLDLPLDAPLPRQCAMAVPLLEAIEQRATEAGVPVDSRIERGRNHIHALRQAIAQERFDRIVMAAAAQDSPGFDADDVAWLLDNAKGEIVILRPGADDQIGLPPAVGGRRRTAPPRTRRPLPRRALSRVSEMAGSR